MTDPAYLPTNRDGRLFKAIEECGEVLQAFGKAGRFGLRSHHPSDPETTNAHHLLAEVADLRAALDACEPDIRRVLGHHGLAAPQGSSIEAYFAIQIAWSHATFGSGQRTRGICNHIRKELLEIEAAPFDLSEWIDVVILAMDGFWRHGGTPESLLAHLNAKQRKNMARQWPDPTSDDEPVEHIRSGEVAS